MTGNDVLELSPLLQRTCLIGLHVGNQDIGEDPFAQGLVSGLTDDLAEGFNVSDLAIGTFDQ